MSNDPNSPNFLRMGAPEQQVTPGVNTPLQGPIEQAVELAVFTATYIAELAFQLERAHLGLENPFDVAVEIAGKVLCLSNSTPMRS
jgi:hypothetical protein